MHGWTMRSRRVTTRPRLRLRPERLRARPYSAGTPRRSATATGTSLQVTGLHGNGTASHSRLSKGTVLMAELFSQKKYEFEPPGGLKIYRLRSPSVSEEGVQRLGGRFDLEASVDAGAFIHDARGIAYVAGSSWGLRLFSRSGGWQYRHAARSKADRNGV